VDYQQEQRLRHVDNQQEHESFVSFGTFGSFAGGTLIVPAADMHDLL